jgi:diguanylate cyclase (GGDEF)-like protein
MVSETVQPSRFGAASIKSRLMIFALAATLVPTLSLGWLYLNNNRTLLTDKVSQGLVNTAQNQARELSLWVQDRRDELRVVGSSYIFTENLAQTMAGNQEARDNLAEYLQSVSSRLTDPEALAVTDVVGEPIMISVAGERWVIPAAWPSRLTRRELPLSEPSQEAIGDGFQMLLGSTIRDLNNQPLGILVARLPFVRIDALLLESYQQSDDAVYLIDGAGRVIASDQSGAVSLGDMLGKALDERLGSGRVEEFWHQDGTKVVGTLAEVPDTPWRVVTERRSDVAFADVRRLENQTYGLGLAIVVLTSLIAYAFARGMTAPLSRLTTAAARVASGDMAFDLKVDGQDEIAYLTRAFNNMIGRVNEGREELDKINSKLRDQNRKLQVLSNTDPLTGLYNRQHLTMRLKRLLSSCKRSDRKFAVLMLDLDHFKKLNDEHGHLVGDEALKLIADILRKTLRNRDYAARFGGEEFLVLLPGADAQRGEEIAERLRSSIADQPLTLEHGVVTVTMSIGLAVYPEVGNDIDSLIRAADKALYDAKNAGRNQCITADKPALRVIS